MTALPFDMLGEPGGSSPVVLSVPHAGRDYPPALCAVLAAPRDALVSLEDRHVDAVALAARTDETILIQRLPRAWIDLNRGEDERDWQVDEGAVPPRPGGGSAKLRSGLGLVPRRGGASRALWRRRFSGEEIHDRIVNAHRPYHMALQTALAATRARWGVAVLLDLHSMPPLGRGGAQLVIGDRFGQTMAGRLVARIEAEAQRVGCRTALNAPYAGGHILQRHAAPAAGIHAVQLELDRSLYLDERLDQPGPGLTRTAALVRQIAAALADEALHGALPQAAE